MSDDQTAFPDRGRDDAFAQMPAFNEAEMVVRLGRRPLADGDSQSDLTVWAERGGAEKTTSGELDLSLDDFRLEGATIGRISRGKTSLVALTHAQLDAAGRPYEVTESGGLIVTRYEP